MAPNDVKMSGAARVLGALFVILAIAAAGLYSYQSGMWAPHHQQVVANNQLPQTSPPSH
jgi:hypothetical protein